MEPTDLSVDHHLRIHTITVSALYAVSLLISAQVLSRPEAQKDLVTLLSTGAILATFGSALSSLGSLWEGDLLERVRLNVDILFKDILRQDTPWRRWPFLPRAERRRMLDGTQHHAQLSNPEVLLDVGTHTVRISLPTVLQDFFDLPVFKNLWPLVRFRTSAQTVFVRKKKGEKNPKTGMDRLDEHMAYECMHDIWKSVFRFRLARYTAHLGAGLTMSSAAVTAYQVAARAV